MLLTARLDESDRGVLQAGQTAIIHLDAIPDRDYHASVTDVSLLARVDYSNWPPVKNFADLRLTFTDMGNARLRPGMSAAARIAVGHLPDMLLVPTEAVFLVDGRARVYRLSAGGRAVEPVIVDVVKRNKVQTAVKGRSKPGTKSRSRGRTRASRQRNERPQSDHADDPGTRRRGAWRGRLQIPGHRRQHRVGRGASGADDARRQGRAGNERARHPGSLRAVQTTVISAPAVGGSILRLVTMAETGAEVQKGDVVMEFDPTESSEYCWSRSPDRSWRRPTRTSSR